MSKTRRKAGLPPGTIIFTGEQKVSESSIHHLCYNESAFSDSMVDTEEINQTKHLADHINWYDIRGLHDTQWLNQIAEIFGISALVLEDIVDVYKRPSFASYTGGHLLVMKALSYDESTMSVSSEHISIYFREDMLISFQEDESDIFHQIRKRLKEKQGKIRQRGADYLMFALCDLIVDYYYQVIEKIQISVELQEDEILANTSSNQKESIHMMRKEVIKIRKMIYPLREAISQLLRLEGEIIQESTDVYLRGLYDHTIHVLDMLDTQRDLLNGLQELYLSEINFRMNEIMKVLTIMSAIFVPLSFLAGLYGMNFAYIPELSFRYGYHTLLAVMVILVIGLIYWFKRRHWL